MKKSAVKKLKITKKTVATLSKTEMKEAKGGDRTWTACSDDCSRHGGCTTTTAYTKDNSSVCKCL